jgi:hypothetical protein
MAGGQMSAFTSPLIVSPMSDGKNWQLKKKFTYHVGSKFSRTYINVPKFFITDFASIPSIFFFLPKWSRFNKAPVLHDYLYKTRILREKPITRKQADDIFLEAMLIDLRNHRTGKLIAYIEYFAVRAFAFLAWKNNLHNIKP